ncbi:MAG: T9SS type A sorting domain-containing protein [Bacteroidia bacterium]
MKKLLFISSLLVSGLLSAQTPNYPYSENFDATTVGSIPTGWATDAFAVMAGNHGVSNTQAITAEMKTGHTVDSLTTPPIGPLTASSVITLQYRIAANVGGVYPQQTAALVAGDQILLKAYVTTPPYSAFGYITAATISTTSNPALTSGLAFSTFSYSTSALPVSIAGDYAQLRIVIQRGATSTADYFLDIDNVTVQDATSGIATNAAHLPALSVFPNPSNGNFTVLLKNYQANTSVEVSVYNYLGQKVKTVNAEGAVNNQISVNTLGLEKGMYLIEVKSGSEVAKTKIQID